MVSNLIHYFWPDIDDTDIKKFSLLSLTLFLIIGSYWLLRLLKDTVFMTIAFPESMGWAPQQGGLFQPIAKMWSPVVIICCVFLYSKLVDMFEQHQLFYVLCTFYMIVFGSITGVLFARSIGGDVALGKTILAATGWVSYLSVESFGSIMVPLFWSFVVSVTDSKTAKIGFPLIIAGAQFGSIGFSALTIFSTRFGGIRSLFLVATILVAAITVVIYHFMKVIPTSHMKTGFEEVKAEPKEKENFIYGFYSGIKLLFSHPYLIGVFVVSTVYEIVGTIIDYQMKRYAAISPLFPGEEGFAHFMGLFGVSVNTLALLLALLGTAYFMKRFGLRVCLLIYPITFGIALLVFYFLYMQGFFVDGRLLWGLFALMVLSRGLTYAVNNPSKDMMYIPTSKDARYKAKGWTDMFGSRSAKMTGANINNALKYDLTLLITVGTVLGLGIVVVWIFAAVFVGKKNQELLRTGTIIG